MRRLLKYLAVVVIAAHGAVHLVGAAAGLGWADPPLSQPIGAAPGVGWLVAGILVLGVAVMLARGTRGWWIVAAVAAVLSQALVVSDWADAKAGTVGTVLLLLAAGYGYLAEGPRGLRAEYRRRRDAAVEAAPAVSSAAVTEAELDPLPRLVAGYVRRSGAVGRPRVTTVHARFHGRIRGGPDKPWMSFTGEQYNSFGATGRRFFLLDATMFGLPVDVLHVFDEDGATMRGRLCSLIRVLDARGSEMDRSESVTIFNDLCILAPAALVDAPIDWQEIDDHRVRGTFRGAAHTVRAELVFDDDGDLVDFVSDDRLRGPGPDGGFTRMTWRTPVGGYRVFDGRRVAARGEARWLAGPPEGEFAYVELHIDGISHGPSDGEPPERAAGTVNAAPSRDAAPAPWQRSA